MSKLFKFYSVNNFSISALTNGYCWFSDPNTFNDPFDTKILQCDLLQKESFSKEKILCLTEVNDNLLMWSHYSNSHKGFCVEFTDYTDAELTLLKHQEIYPDADNSRLPTIRNAIAVKYLTTQEIEEYILDIPHNDAEFSQLLSSLEKEQLSELVKRIQSTTFIKHSDWQYEKEFRLVNTKTNFMCFPGKITAIYFGMNAASFEKRMIGLIVDPHRNKGIKFYQMNRPHGKYSLIPRPFDLKKDLGDLGSNFKI